MTILYLARIEFKFTNELKHCYFYDWICKINLEIIIPLGYELFLDTWNAVSLWDKTQLHKYDNELYCNTISLEFQRAWNTAAYPFSINNIKEILISSTGAYVKYFRKAYTNYIYNY